MERGAYLFTTDGKLLAQSSDGETREATAADRTQVGRALRVPQPFWRWWLGGGAEPSDD